jgi:hypothetical protein
MRPELDEASSIYVRFVVNQRDANSGRRQGLFQATGASRDSGVLGREDWDRLAAAREWLNHYLERPSRLVVSRRPHAKAQAISWFKNPANNHIAQMRELQHILEKHGVAVEVLTTERPGYIVYEDEFQVAAYPFRDAQT